MIDNWAGLVSGRAINSTCAVRWAAVPCIFHSEHLHTSHTHTRIFVLQRTYLCSKQTFCISLKMSTAIVSSLSNVGDSIHQVGVHFRTCFRGLSRYIGEKCCRDPSGDFKLSAGSTCCMWLAEPAGHVADLFTYLRWVLSWQLGDFASAIQMRL